MQHLRKTGGEGVCPLRTHHSFHIRGIYVHRDPRLSAHAAQWSKTDAAPPASHGKAPCAGFPSPRPARLSAIPQIQPGEPRSESARPAAGPSAPAARKRNRETKQAPIAPGGLSSAARNCKEEENVEPLSLPTQPRRAFHALRKCTRHTSVPATSLALARSIGIVVVLATHPPFRSALQSFAPSLTGRYVT